MQLGRSFENAQLQQTHPLDSVCQTFTEKFGGKLILIDENNPIALLTTDCVYPICGAGENRSQVLYRIVYPYACAHVFEPHSADAKLDAYFPDFECLLLPTAMSESAAAFRAAFGVDRLDIVGEERFRSYFGDYYPPGSPLFQESRQYFSEHYYGHALSADQPRHVFIAFQKTVHVVLKRLCDVAEEQHKDLSRVVVCAVDMGDIVAHPQTEGIKSHSVEAFKAAAETIGKLVKQG
eukprot:TRINITY_DN13171_c0_g1_i1.p1 TRINITY_DN13171_c0_g1~~TRINITY_DN13171_c0_g1_i1.p1  ORF type:complete len:236 (+),score=36.85 TRINITY_DN13171_c0_g1_i1:92-799(+)